MADTLVKTIADFNTTLALKVAVGATTATLTSATDDDGVALPTGTYGFTIDRKGSNKEYIQCTLTGTALTDIRTVLRGTGVSSAGFAEEHRKGAEVIISDWVAIKRIQDVLETGYASATTPSTDYQLATKKYVDDTAIAGASNASTTTQGLVEIATQAEVDAGTETGGTGAKLVQTPNQIRARAYHDYAADAVGTDSYAITISPAITAYAAGQVFTFKAGTANTGACTLNVSGLGAKTIKKDVSTDLSTGDILANQDVVVVYDGTNMQMVSALSGLKNLANMTGTLPVANGGTGLTSSSAIYAYGSETVTSSSPTVIAHGMGVTPKHIKIVAIPAVTDTTATSIRYFSEGIYNGTNYHTIFTFPTGAGTGTNNSNISTSYVLNAHDCTATVTLDSTNITLTWTSFANTNLIWEAWGI